jgi:PAS domain S-box-containing protein
MTPATTMTPEPTAGVGAGGVGVESPGAFLALILDGVPQPVWVVDEDGVIAFANPAAVAALGYDRAADLRGLPSHETVHHKWPDGSPRPVEGCLMLRPRVTGETVHCDDDWFVRRDGSMFPIAWWSAPIDMPGGRGAVLAFTDITERRAAEQVVRERDAAEIRAAESRAAQRRIVESTTAARQEMARNLHDGAQQQLVNVLIGLQLAREELAADPGRARQLLDDAAAAAQAAIGELRELAAGLHPSILANRGLFSAIEALAARAPLPVVVTGSVAERVPAAVEASAYFFTAEALTNAVKHAGASRVDVTVGIAGRVLTVEVRDDGVGGAGTGGTGSGLTGLLDRIEALDGRLVIDSPPGAGTTLRAEIPLA